MSGFFLQLFCDQNKTYSVIIEDDGKVTYAYLMLAKEIIGDLWLYNNETAPEGINWEQQELPYLNPVVFLKEDIHIAPITNRHDLLCQWTMDSCGEELLEVNIILRKALIGRLKPGALPGYSALVKRDGPLAKILADEAQ